MQKMNKDIAICIFTYNKPILLRKCIESISNQSLQNFDLFIIDNDKEKTAERVVRFLNYNSNIQLKYYNEFSNTINNPFKLIKDNYKYLAAIDDNKIADIYWLRNLYTTIIQNKTDIVFGSMHSKASNQNNSFIATNVIINIKIFRDYKNELLEELNSKANFENYIFKIKNNSKNIFSKNSILYFNLGIKKSKLNFKRFYNLGNSRAFILKSKKKYYKIIKITLSSIFKILSSIIIFFPNLILLTCGYEKYFNKMINRFSKSIGFIFGLFGHKFGDF